MARLSAKAARERLELLAPEVAEVLGSIVGSFKEQVLNAELSVKERVALSKELRAIAAQVLDRGGVPAVRQVQTENRSLMLTGSTRDVVAEIARRMTRLEPQDRELLLTMAPQLGAMGPDEDA